MLHHTDVFPLQQTGACIAMFFFSLYTRSSKSSKIKGFGWLFVFSVKTKSVKAAGRILKWTFEVILPCWAGIIFVSHSGHV